MQRGTVVRARLAAAAAAVILGAVAVLVLVSTSNGDALTETILVSVQTPAKTTKLDGEDSSADASTGEKEVTLKDLMREVKELQQQEKAHFSAREKALADALSKVTDATAKKNLQWKSAKDKYEQAALNDIQTQDNSRANITQEGEKQFQEYAQKAQELMGTRDLHALLNRTALKESARQSLQEEALSNLRSTEHKLHRVEEEERALEEAKEQRKQQKATSEEQSHMAHIALARAPSSPLADQPDDAAAREEEHAADPTSRDYRSDYRAATQQESVRQDAFREEVAEEKKKVDAERKSRQELLDDDKRGDPTEGGILAEQPSSHHSTVREKADEDVKAMSEKVGVRQRLNTPGEPREESRAAQEMSAAAYEQNEEAARAEAQRESKEEAAAQHSFLAQRQSVLARDSAVTGELSKQLEATSEKLLEPSQVADAAPSHGLQPLSPAATLASGRSEEVASIMDRGDTRA